LAISKKTHPLDAATYPAKGASMTRIKFAIIWGALYAVLVAAVTCFIAWGVPDFGARPVVDRIGALV